MDWFPLWNSLRIAGISAFFVFFAGIFGQGAKKPRRAALQPRSGEKGRGIFYFLPLMRMEIPM